MNTKQIYMFQEIIQDEQHIAKLEKFLREESYFIKDCLIAYAMDKKTPSYIIQYLIDKGCDVNMFKPDLFQTPLFMAIYNGRPDLVEMLLAAGAKITKTDIPAIVFGVKTMDKTDYQSHTNEIETRIIKSLLRRDINQLDWCDTNGNTPLHKAALFGNLESARLLVAHGADITILNQKGKTALDICRKYRSGSRFYYGHQSVSTQLVNLKKPLIAELLEKEEVSYLVFKGFRLHTNDFKTLHKSYPEIVWNRDYKQIPIIPYSPYMVMDVLHEVWSRINDDVFRELMGYLS
jgi:hypothetical protein